MIGIDLIKMTASVCEVDGNTFRFVIPRHIRSGSAYRYLKIEQKGENLHCELNKLERELLSIKNVPSRYLMMIKKVENKLKATTKCQELSE